MKLRTGFAASTAAALALALALLPATAASAVPLPTGDLTGTVEDPSGNPVSDANVSVASASHLYAATTGADGTFSFPSILAGEYRVGWYKFGAYPIGLESTENVVAGDTTELQLVIPNTSEMTVTVTDGVNPLEDAFVSYVSDD